MQSGSEHSPNQSQTTRAKTQGDFGRFMFIHGVSALPVMPYFAMASDIDHTEDKSDSRCQWVIQSDHCFRHQEFHAFARATDHITGRLAPQIF